LAYIIIPIVCLVTNTLLSQHHERKKDRLEGGGDLWVAREETRCRAWHRLTILVLEVNRPPVQNSMLYCTEQCVVRHTLFLHVPITAVHSASRRLYFRGFILWFESQMWL